MASDKDNVKIEINIAGEFIQLAVPRDKQLSVRECEKAINELYSEWRHKFPRKAHSELMAMMTYQYASYFQELSARYDRLTQALSRTSERLDDIIGSKP